MIDNYIDSKNQIILGPRYELFSIYVSYTYKGIQFQLFFECENPHFQIRLPYSDRGAAFYTTVSVIGSRIYLIGGSNGLFA